MVQYGIKLSTKHPSEINNNLKLSYLKSILLKIKLDFFTIFQLRLRYFVMKKNVGPNYFANIRFVMFLAQLDRQK